MPQGLREEELFQGKEDLSIDDIFIKHAVKINSQLRDIVPSLRAQGPQVFEKATLPSLTVLLHET